MGNNSLDLCSSFKIKTDFHSKDIYGKMKFSYNKCFKICGDYSYSNNEIVMWLVGFHGTNSKKFWTRRKPRNGI